MQKAPSNARSRGLLFANESVRLLNHPVLSRTHDDDGAQRRENGDDDGASPDVDEMHEKNRIARPV
jgi:hypothetical protein